LPDAAPPIVAMVSVVSQLMLKPAGMWMRRSFAAEMVGVAASSVIVMVLIRVSASPTAKPWLAAEEMP